ncbi:MAG: phosphotransferase [Chloroflexi bacterium]|nr:phosphotransferase [Chloroflexota bacterium]
MTGPAASGVRLPWEGLPDHVRQAVEGYLGSTVVAAVTQPGGFSPGVAARLTAADGQRVFVKAVSPHPNKDAPRFHRRERRIAAALPAAAPVPRLLWSLDEGDDGWVVLVFEDVEGRHPAVPWEPSELDRVLAALDDLARGLTPSPVPSEVSGTMPQWLERHGQGWQRLLAEPLPGLDGWSARHAHALAALEAQAPVAAAGDTLLHFDTRADNLLVTPEQVYVVDWPHARHGQAWVDPVFFAPSVAMQGGPDPESLLARTEAGRAADPAAVSAVIAAVAGFFTYQSLLPPPPGLPTLRPFQAAQGGIARAWLAQRTGWE